MSSPSFDAADASLEYRISVTRVHSPPPPVPRWYAAWMMGGTAVVVGLCCWSAGLELAASARQRRRRERIKGSRKDPQHALFPRVLRSVALLSGLGLSLGAFAALNRKDGSAQTLRGQPLPIAFAVLAMPVLVLQALEGLAMARRRKALKISKQDQEEADAQAAAPAAPAASAASSSSASSPAALVLSDRLRHIVANDSTPPQNLNHFLRLADPLTYPPFDSLSHPAGYISCAIAENKCCLPWLPNLTVRPGMGLREVGYADFNGMIHVRESLADFLAEYIFGRAVDPSCLLMTAGANIALDSLFFSLANPGEYVLLATPYYAAFAWDLGLKSGVLIHPVEGRVEDQFAFNLADYKRALVEAREQGKVVRAVLLCNPANPLGTMLTRAQLLELTEWVRSEPGLHLVSDEIYALSCYAHLQQPSASATSSFLSRFNPFAAPRASSAFVSLASVLSAEGMSDRFHVIYAFSKDFGISGFRAGVIYTENRAVQRAYGQLSQFNGLSTDVQHFIYLLLSDEAKLGNYILRMQNQLAQVVTMVLRILDEAAIPYVRPQAGLFLWADFSAFLTAPTAAAEMELYELILAEANVNLTPGTIFHSPTPGWFRICHSSEPIETIRVAMQRIVRVLKARKAALQLQA